jgi:hypothetical protein
VGGSESPLPPSHLLRTHTPAPLSPPPQASDTVPSARTRQLQDLRPRSTDVSRSRVVTTRIFTLRCLIFHRDPLIRASQLEPEHEARRSLQRGGRGGRPGNNQNKMRCCHSDPGPLKPAEKGGNRVGGWGGTGGSAEGQPKCVAAVRAAAARRWNVVAAACRPTLSWRAEF